jgi:ribonuclease P protein component
MIFVTSQTKLYGFPKEVHLRKASEFKAVFNQSRRFAARNFVVYCCHNDLANPRLGISISKKNVRHATDRNRIKRLIRETFRLCQTPLANLDMVVVAYRGSDNLTNADLQRNLNELWQILATRYKKV